MSSLPPMLTHLADLIHLREERLEKTEIPFLRNQLSAEIQGLMARFESEYQAFLRAAGRAQAFEVVKVAA